MILADETLSFALFMTALSVIFVLSLFGIGWIVSRVMGRDDRITRCHLQSLSADLEVHETPEPGDVALIYRTFHGFQLWMVSVEHRYVLSPADARCLLGRLLQFNLTHGMHSSLGPLIAPVALFNYLMQRRSISRQEATGVCAMSAIYASYYREKSLRQPPALYRRVIGYMCAGLTALMVFSMLIGFFAGGMPWEAFLGMIFFCTILGTFAYDFAVR